MNWSSACLFTINITITSSPNVLHWVRAVSDVYRDISRSNKEHTAAARQRFWLYLIYKYSLALRSLVSIPFLPSLPLSVFTSLCLTHACLLYYDIWSQSVKQSVFDAIFFYITSEFASIMLSNLLCIRSFIYFRHEQLYYLSVCQYVVKLFFHLNVHALCPQLKEG